MARIPHSANRGSEHGRGSSILGRRIRTWLLGIAAVGFFLFAALLSHRGSPLLAALRYPTANASTVENLLPADLRPRPGQSTVVPPTVRGRVGIVSGHQGPENDPGAVCPDGLREADINRSVASLVADVLTRRGYQVDLLDEFDARLRGYRADAFLAIHTDSCAARGVSGFKVARVVSSAIPKIEDLLVQRLYEEYGRATALPRHDFSITPDMHEYHAFLEIAPQTPGAIIELGFMSTDRNILTRQPQRPAAGIVAGLLRFLEK